MMTTTMGVSSDLLPPLTTRMSSNMSSTMEEQPTLLSPLELYFAGLVNLKVDDDDENDVQAEGEEEKKDSSTDDTTASSSTINDADDALPTNRRQDLLRRRESSTSSFSSTCELTLTTDHARLPSKCLRRIARFHSTRQQSFLSTPCTSRSSSLNDCVGGTSSSSSCDSTPTSSPPALLLSPEIQEEQLRTIQAILDDATAFANGAVKRYAAAAQQDPQEEQQQDVSEYDDTIEGDDVSSSSFSEWSSDLSFISPTPVTLSKSIVNSSSKHSSKSSSSQKDKIAKKTTSGSSKITNSSPTSVAMINDQSRSQLVMMSPRSARWSAASPIYGGSDHGDYRTSNSNNKKRSSSSRTTTNKVVSSEQPKKSSSLTNKYNNIPRAPLGARWGPGAYRINGNGDVTTPSSSERQDSDSSLPPDYPIRTPATPREERDEERYYWEQHQLESQKEKLLSLKDAVGTLSLL